MSGERVLFASPFQNPLEVAELIGSALGSSQFPMKQQLTLTLAPVHTHGLGSSTPISPQQQGNGLRWDAGKSRQQSPLLLGYQVKSSIVNGGGNL